MTYTEGKGELGLGRTEKMYLHILMKSFQYSLPLSIPMALLSYCYTCVCMCVSPSIVSNSL